MIPFIEAVDDLVRQIADNDGHGKMIVEVTSQHVMSDPNLKKQFEQALLLSFDTLDPIREAATTVYANLQNLWIVSGKLRHHEMDWQHSGQGTPPACQFQVSHSAITILM